MERLLIIGCGDVARRALPRLAPRYRLYALVRSTDVAQAAEFAALGVTTILGDLDRPATLQRLAGLADLVLHFAPPPERGNLDTRTRHLIAALQRGKILPRRLIYISTSGVYGDCGGAWVSETRRTSPHTSRARRRIDAECQLRRWGKRGGPVVSILRAPGIYAAERLPVDRIRRGDPVLRSEDDVFTNHIHADDLARCALAALRHGGPNRVYHASDDSVLPGLKMADWFDAVAAAYALPRPRRISRAEAATQLAPLTLSFMSESRRLDNTRIKQELRVRLDYPDVTVGLARIRAAREDT
ncbi:MAG: NAD(P)H-binding protein [Proteobacteria bacterium]|nr:NAD(P)H-binding protein [Pseudomonadota bacterium]